MLFLKDLHFTNWLEHSLKAESTKCRKTTGKFNFFSAFFRKQLEAHWTVPESCWLFLSQANFCSLKSLSNLLILVQMTLPWTSINTANISSIHPVFIMIFHFLEISSDKSEAFLKVGVVSQAILHFHNLQQFIYTHKKSPIWVHSCCL